MKKVSMYGAVASVFLLAAAPAALAQNYNPNYGQDTNQSQNWNRSGSDWNRSGSDWNRSGADWNQGGQGWNRSGVQSGWNSGQRSGLEPGQVWRRQSGPVQRQLDPRLGRLATGFPRIERPGVEWTERAGGLSGTRQIRLQKHPGHGAVPGLGGARHEEWRSRARLYR